MKFTVLPIINEYPTDIKVFYKIYENKYAAKLAFNRSKWVYTRTRLAEAQNWKCCFCGCVMTEIRDKRNSVTVEHVVPKSMGGTDEIDNLVASCYSCNNNRKTDDAYMFRPISSIEKSKNLVRIEAKVRKYVKKAHKFSEIDFKVNEKIQTFDDWFSTIQLCHKGKKMFFAEYNKR